LDVHATTSAGASVVLLLARQQTDETRRVLAPVRPGADVFVAKGAQRAEEREDRPIAAVSGDGVWADADRCPSMASIGTASVRRPGKRRIGRVYMLR
jgi:porphobilinogen deaminase